MSGQSGGRDVVVGLDDSLSSRAALSWAADYARATGSRLCAVHIFSVERALVGWTPGVPGMAYLGETASRTESAARVREVFGQVHPDPGWTLELDDGPIGPVLVERSRGAAALVVGTHDHVGIDRLLLGSVSHHCLSHAGCPVVAVPAAPLRARSADPTQQRTETRPAAVPAR